MFNSRRRRGFSLIELLIVIAIILIIITIAVPKYQKTQIFVRETAAIAAMQTIHKMEVQYQSQYGRYAISLTELGPPASGAPSPAAADLIGNDLSGGVNKGYKFTLTGTQGGYVINANPINFGSDGNRTFFSDQSMVIRNNFGQEPATATSPELNH
ncbi:MAG TPA: prepilin-type N-terminal cleavage/methylation domain-containing protein [Candidatus Acidoferrales bacterium]|nr:prepilin-type N-terminal cleavage/methylation domain-containing protein [Candidatus Acidoferrales bacterium]